MDDYSGRNESSQRTFNMCATAALILAYVAFCAPKQVIVDGVKTDSKQCYEDYKYVKAHKENEDHLEAFSRGVSLKLQNKPNILIDSSVGVCGKSADDALSRSSDAEFERLFAILKENAGQ